MTALTFDERVAECMAQCVVLYETVGRIDPAVLISVIKLADTQLGHTLFEEFAKHEESLRLPPAPPGERAKAMVKILKLAAFFIDELKKIEVP